MINGVYQKIFSNIARIVIQYIVLLFYQPMPKGISLKTIQKIYHWEAIIHVFMVVLESGITPLTIPPIGMKEVVPLLLTGWQYMPGFSCWMIVLV